MFIFVLPLFPIGNNPAYGGRDCSKLEAAYNAAVTAEQQASENASRAFKRAFTAAAATFSITIWVTVRNSRGAALLVPKKVLTTAGVAAAIMAAYQSMEVMDAYAALSVAAQARQAAWTALDFCKTRHDCGCLNTTVVYVRTHLDGCGCQMGREGQCPCEVPAPSSGSGSDDCTGEGCD